MGDLVKVDANGIVNILNNGGALNIGRPFSQEIFLIDVEIAGTSHVENMLEIEPKLVEGAEVKFFRECDNRFDGNKLGYVPIIKEQIKELDEKDKEKTLGMRDKIFTEMN